MVGKNSTSWANFQALNMYSRVYFYDKKKSQEQKGYFIGLVWNMCKMK